MSVRRTVDRGNLAKPMKILLWSFQGAGALNLIMAIALLAYRSKAAEFMGAPDFVIYIVIAVLLGMSLIYFKIVPKLIIKRS